MMPGRPKLGLNVCVSNWYQTGHVEDGISALNCIDHAITAVYRLACDDHNKRAKLVSRTTAVCKSVDLALVGRKS